MIKVTSKHYKMILALTGIILIPHPTVGMDNKDNKEDNHPKKINEFVFSIPNPKNVDIVSLNEKNEKEAKKLFLLGKKFREGIDVEKNPKKAYEYFKAASNKSFECQEALYEMAHMHLNGEGIPENIPQAIYFFEQLEKLGEFSSGLVLGDIYCFGKGEIKKNIQKAIQYYKKVAETKCSTELETSIKGQALHKLASLYSDGIDIKENIKTAIQYYKEAIAHGCKPSLFKLAFLYQTKTKTKENLPKAIQLYERIIKEKDPNTLPALHNLGSIYVFESEKTNANRLKGIRYYEQAEEKGYQNSKDLLKELLKDPSAVGNMGNCYFCGIDVDKKDEPQAIKYYEMAIEKGGLTSLTILGLNNLGDFYVKDEKKLSQAIECFEMASEKGDKTAKGKLQPLYERQYSIMREILIKHAQEKKKKLFHF